MKKKPKNVGKREVLVKIRAKLVRKGILKPKK
jgi:hypothetical protein